MPGRSNATWPLPSSSPSAIGRSKPPASFFEIGRGQVDHDAIDRPAVSRVDDRPLDPVRALLDGRLGQADQHRLGHRRGRDVDLDLDRRGVDADQVYDESFASMCRPWVEAIEPSTQGDALAHRQKTTLAVDKSLP